jgi:hypothetical protein
MVNVDHEEIRLRTVSAVDYVNCMDEQFKEKFLARKLSYRLNQDSLNGLRGAAARKFFVIVFSAGWCKDCAQNVPVLALVSEATGLEVRVFGGLKKDPLSVGHKWRIPPSPPEVEKFNVEALPLMIIVNSQGKEVGRIVENPKCQPTLEQELNEIVQTSARAWR